MQAVIHKGRPTYAYPAQMDTDIWYVQRPDGKYEPCTQSELRFVQKSPATEHREMLADPSATEWATLSESIDWRLVLIVAALVLIVYAVIEYGWLAVVRPLAGVLCVLAIMAAARKS